MTDSKRESCMATLATNLAEIKVNAGYETDVSTVERWIKAPDMNALDYTKFPLVIVEEGGETIDYQPGRVDLCQMTPRLRLYLTGESSYPDAEDLNALIGDVRKCLADDIRLTDNAISCEATAVSVDVSADHPYAQAIVDLSITYENDDSTP